MNYKKYRACLLGIIAVALICGALIYMKVGKENQVPTDGTLVENSENYGDKAKLWA